MKSFLHNNDIEMYSTHIEGKSVIGERFIRTLKNKIYKYMTSISKNVYIDILDDIENRYNNTYNNTNEMRPVDVKSSTYIDSSKQIIDKDPKFKISDVFRISKYKNIFAKAYTPDWPEEGFLIRKVKIMCRGRMSLIILMMRKFLELLTKEKYKKQIKKSLELTK